MSSWIKPQTITRSSLVPGDYTTPAPILVDDSASVELAPADAAATYITLSNSGPNEIYVSLGVAATTTAYNVIIPPGFNTWQERIGNQSLNAICATGETATLMVATAPETSKIVG